MPKRYVAAKRYNPVKMVHSCQNGIRLPKRYNPMKKYYPAKIIILLKKNKLYNTAKILPKRYNLSKKV